jgi:putative serine protease PepD
MGPRATTVAAAVPLLAFLLAGCGGGGGGTANHAGATGGTPASNTDGTSGLQQRFEAVVRDVSPQVVQISTSSGLGSGVVYDANGNIVTNHHVVGSSRSFTVTLSDGSTHPAKLVGSFAPEDLAVVRLTDMRPKPATFADSSKLVVGQFAFAMGNPLGLRSSVTEGIVSSLGRTVSEGPGGGVISSAIQTSAPINPGNSGGALVDIDGKVIGIPTLAALDPDLGGAQAPGIGFAIPANTVKRIADQIVATGRVTNSGQAYLGVRVASGVSGTGVIVASVQKGGPADQAGIRANEVIVAIDGQPVTSTDALGTIMAGHKPGDRVTVELLDPDGSKRSVTVTLGQLAT